MSTPTEMRGIAEEGVSPLEPSSSPFAGVSFHSHPALSTGFRRLNQGGACIRAEHVLLSRHSTSKRGRHVDVPEDRVFGFSPRRVTNSRQTLELQQLASGT
jgi:hypothetical protein